MFLAFNLLHSLFISEKGSFHLKPRKLIRNAIWERSFVVTRREIDLVVAHYRTAMSNVIKPVK